MVDKFKDGMRELHLQIVPEQALFPATLMQVFAMTTSDSLNCSNSRLINLQNHRSAV